MNRLRPIADREQWAEDHGYWHGTCKVHGGFWTDSTRCPYCPNDEKEEEDDDSEM